jgi:hypothetical protein
MNGPDWWPDTTPQDWLFDGYQIKGAFLDLWNDLDWAKAYVDAGPSPAGNPGPYWHVPLKSGDSVHRLYPKIPGRWRIPAYRAVRELSGRSYHAGGQSA